MAKFKKRTDKVEKLFSTVLSFLESKYFLNVGYCTVIISLLKNLLSIYNIQLLVELCTKR